MERIAIMDLGSNSVRLVIIEINENNSYRIVNEVKEMARLSEGMGVDSKIKPEALSRTLKTLKLFKRLCDASNISYTMAVATAAVRKAQNQKEVLEAIKSETGISFEVITGEKEAELGFRGVESTLSISSGYVMDIGGGSTEITRFDECRIQNSISMPFGAVTLTEMFLDKDKSPQKKLDELEKYLLKQYKNVPWIKERKAGSTLVGLGGTIRTLSKMDRLRKGYSLDLTHNYRMNSDTLEELYNSMKLLGLEERINLPGMSRDRADIIVAGCCAVNMLAKVLNAGSFVASGSGIREGLFYEYFLSKYKDLPYKNISDMSIDNMLKLYNANLVHARQVQRIALKLYDQLSPIHGLKPEYRQLLEWAALVHDVGIVVDFYNRDEHTFYIITNAKLNGLTHREILLMGLAASKFSGEKLKKHYMKHRDIITNEDYLAVKKLISILQISDKLDRSKSGVIRSISCSISSKSIIMYTEKSGGDGELEIAEARKHLPGFKKVFGRDLQIV